MLQWSDLQHEGFAVENLMKIAIFSMEIKAYFVKKVTELKPRFSTESKYLQEYFTYGYLQIRGSSEEIIGTVLKSPIPPLGSCCQDQPEANLTHTTSVLHLTRLISLDIWDVLEHSQKVRVVYM